MHVVGKAHPADPGVPASASRRRISQLDGLRGLAALVVAIHHSLLVTPALEYAHAEPRPEVSGLFWWLAYTPLHLGWAGNEAVYLFFILSGFVLCLPFLSGKGPRWRDYYPRRLARLYLPVWGAVAFTLVLVAIFPRVSRPEQSGWVNGHAMDIGLSSIAKDLTLLSGTTMMDSPLWSLRWEVLFSLLLPIYLLVLVRLSRWWGPLLLVMFALEWWAPNAYAVYLPMFGIGVLLAARRDLLDRLAAAIPDWAWPLLLAGSLALVNARWYPAYVSAHRILTIAGAALLVVTLSAWRDAEWFGNLAPVVWLGKVSFSLYLVHEPIVLSVAMVTGSTNPLVSLCVALPLSLLASAAFYRWVEYPAHLLSRRLRLPGPVKAPETPTRASSDSPR